jgi:threonine/homoserine/homoserine lactone efflux protein
MTVEFLLVVLVVVLVPGVDLMMVLRNTIARGRVAGLATAAGVGVASALQGTLVAFGVGAVIVQHEWLFQTIRWVGIAYLLYLGIMSLVSALRHLPTTDPTTGTSAGWGRGLIQGFFTNITNPKMLVFYLSLLPQFLDPSAPLFDWLRHAWVLPIVGTMWLCVVAGAAAFVRARLLRPLAQRLIDTVAGVTLVGFGVKLALDH